MTNSTSRLAGGLFESVRHLHESMYRKGVDTKFYSISDRYWKEDIDAWGEVKPYAYENVLSSYCGPDRIHNQLRQLEPDLCHVHGLWQIPSYWADSWQKKTGGNVIVSPRGMLDQWALEQSKLKKRIALTLHERRFLNKSTCIHALCEPEAEAIREVSSSPVAVIPNGIHLPEEIETSLRYNSPKVLLFLSRIHPKKGFVELVAAWRRCNDLDDWVLVIAGWGGTDDVSELVGLGVEEISSIDAIDGLPTNSIAYIGPVFGEQKQTLFRRSSGFILPSFSEGLPMAVLEAWSYGLPVLITEPCNLNIGFEVDAAIRIEPDPESIAEGLVELVELAELDRIRIGKNGSDLVREDYSWAKIADKMISVYNWGAGQAEKPDFVSHG